MLVFAIIFPPKSHFISEQFFEFLGGADAINLCVKSVCDVMVEVSIIATALSIFAK